MPKMRVYLFDKDGARYLCNPPNVDELKQQSNVVVNPNLEKVLGLAPHLWALKNGEVVPADQTTKAPKARKRLRYRLQPLFYALLGAGLALAIRAYF